tara:strand:+ start:128 stop:595 length:468 start_codon:yes stop_codon:yes gene_type:complete
MARWINDAEVNQFLSMGAQPLTHEDEVTFVQNAYKTDAHVVLGIWHNADQKLIGNTGFHQIDQLNQTASFGIVIGEKDYWSKGVGSEALDLMLSYAFTIRNLRNVTLSVFGQNARAIRCYEKCGFVPVGTYTAHRFKSGAWQDEHLMIAHNPLYA